MTEKERLQIAQIDILLTIQRELCEEILNGNDFKLILNRRAYEDGLQCAIKLIEKHIMEL